ncbi:hypothetical protein SCHPADRAFT_131253 [Schizopora paradoxa]|uniref:Uncharacterized protein n=1 Tax=Schizopora paradoxa TaxID=27342 RepID=A0A0H2S8X5_9AGAM|nr:hypothetical protein SCHPADRAFT_131253 [Schizopora paradoxa]
MSGIVIRQLELLPMRPKFLLGVKASQLNLDAASPYDRPASSLGFRLRRSGFVGLPSRFAIGFSFVQALTITPTPRTRYLVAYPLFRSCFPCLRVAPYLVRRANRNTDRWPIIGS